MVHDPRVSSVLARLGGIYREPSRVDREAATVLKSSVGSHLTPIIAQLVENNGEVCRCLVLQGTIAMHFRGNTYQLLVDIYLPPGFPQRPPIAFVRLTENMYIKENHMHVASDGKVYLPYLHEWNYRTHNLVELVVNMSSVFSADPPVFTRATPPPPPAATTPPPTAQSIYQQQRKAREQAEAEARLAQEAAEANRVAEAARKAQREEEERQIRIASQKAWEEQKLAQTFEKVNAKVVKHLQDQSNKIKLEVQNDMRDQKLLEIASEKVQKQVEHLESTKERLTNLIAVVDRTSDEMKERIEEAQRKKEEDGEAVHVDDLVQPVNALHGQMLELAAENASYTDALYFLDRALYNGTLDCQTHLKFVRQLAKKQFLVRAHLLKINRQVMQYNHQNGDLPVATMSSF